MFGGVAKISGEDGGEEMGAKIEPMRMMMKMVMGKRRTRTEIETTKVPME